MDLLNEDLIPFADVAAKFHVSVRTVVYWHRVGVKRDMSGNPIRLEAIKPGKKYLTTWDAVNKFAANKENGLLKSELDKKSADRNAYYEAKLRARLYGKN